MKPDTRRASEAQRLLDEPLLNEALDRLEQDTLNEILGAPFWSDRKRRMLTDRVRVIRGIREHLRSVILTGRDADRSRLSVV